MRFDSAILLGLFLASYGLAYVFGEWDSERTRRSHRKLLRLTSVVLVAASILHWRGVALHGPLERYAAWIAVGMALSFLGDLITGEILPFRKPYVAAMGVFALGHISYLMAMAAAREALGAPLEPGWIAATVGGGFLLWAMFLRRRSRGWDVMNWGGLAYALLLSTVLGAALSLASQREEMWPLGVGSVLFFASDTLLGNRVLRKRSWFLMNDVIWALYILGQLMIVWSVRVASGW